MEQQNSPQINIGQPNYEESKKSYLGIIIAVIITLLISSGGVFAWQQMIIKNNEAKNQDVINQLQQQVAILQNKLTEFDKKIKTNENQNFTDPVYQIKELGIGFQYPQKEIFLRIWDSDNKKGQDIGNGNGGIELNITYHKTLENELPLKNALANGQLSYVPERVTIKNRVVKLGDVIFAAESGQPTPGFSFDACNPNFTKGFKFFKDDYTVNISLNIHSVKDTEILRDMPNYLKIDQEKCGNDLMYTDHQGFYLALNNQQGKGVAQTWFNAYQEIIQTIIFN